MFGSDTSIQPVFDVHHGYNCLWDSWQKRQSIKGQCVVDTFLSTLGYVLIGTFLIGQIPQILKVLKRRNATGINFAGILLMLESSSSTVAYAVLNQFPINTWGENLVLMVENVVLVCLLLCYNKRPGAALSFMTVYVIVMLILILPIVPATCLTALYVFSMPMLSLSRVIQIYTNHKNHGSGQLSATSTFLCIFQSFGRLTTSIFVTKDWVMILTFVQVSVLNLILTLQVLYYRRKEKKRKR